MGHWRMQTEGKLFIAVVVAEFIAVCSLTIERVFAWLPWTRDNEDWFIFAIMFLFCCLCVLYFAINGVLKESVFELIAFIFASTLVTAYAVYQFSFPDEDGGERTTTLWIRFITVIVFQIITLPLAFIVIRSFGWRAYKTVGASVALTEIFQKYSIFVSLLKVDVQLAIICLVLAGLSLLSRVELLLDAIAMGLSLVWAIIGWRGARNEVSALMSAFFVFSIVEPAYVAYKYYDFLAFQDDYADVTVYVDALLVMGAVAIVIRASVIVAGYQVFSAFGRGLKVALENADLQDDDDSIKDEEDAYAYKVSASGRIIYNEGRDESNADPLRGPVRR